MDVYPDIFLLFQESKKSKATGLVMRSKSKKISLIVP